jgi:hypothetical protein
MMPRGLACNINVLGEDAICRTRSGRGAGDRDERIERVREGFVNGDRLLRSASAACGGDFTSRSSRCAAYCAVNPPRAFAGPTRTCNPASVPLPMALPAGNLLLRVCALAGCSESSQPDPSAPCSKESFDLLGVRVDESLGCLLTDEPPEPVACQGDRCLAACRWIRELQPDGLR